MTDQQDDIEDDVDAPKCKACGVRWIPLRNFIAICQQYLETVEKLERVTRERDEARRELCIGLADHTDSKFTLPEGCWNQLNVELDRGWDCFKEPTS